MRLLRKRTGPTTWIHPRHCPVPQAPVRPGLKCPAHLFLLVGSLSQLSGHQASHWPLSALPRGPCVAPVGTLPRHPHWWSDNYLSEPSSGQLPFTCAWCPSVSEVTDESLGHSPRAPGTGRARPACCSWCFPSPFCTESHTQGDGPFPLWGCCLGNAPIGLVSFHPSGHFHSSVFRSNVTCSERLSAMFLHRDDLLPFFFISIIRFTIACLFGWLF